ISKRRKKKIFKTIIESNKKVVDGEDIEKLSKLDSEQAIKRFGSKDAEIVSIQLLNKQDKEIDFVNMEMR
ncbi:unnamed protein product, partial [marine sediment metagenome]